jgi:hypothetical protein
MRVGIILAGADVLVLTDGRVGRQPLEPHLVIVMQATLIVVDEYAGRNVLRIYKDQCPPCDIPQPYH